jgi:transposase
MEVIHNAEGLRLEWTVLKDRHTWQQLREGAYLLRTNLSGETAEELWKKYIQLTEAEAAFRALKSELSIRPIFHQLERRVKAHVLVAFLGYALWVTLKHLLRRKNLKTSSAKALSMLSSLRSADIVLPTTDRREIRLRRITTPTQEQQTLLAHLGMQLPERLDFDCECSADSEVN